jgi:protein-S-isoprenylcysteine O-methyltransferase Ste14
MLWLRTILFTLMVLGTVLGLIPLALVSADVGAHVDLGKARLLGLTLFVLGLAIIIWCFIDFVRWGRGTPAPYDPPRELVINGLYRYVRNPQYVGVVLVGLGEALLLGRVVLIGYAVFLAACYHLFVRFYEEPTLGKTFGDAYVHYRATVPRWFPRLGA